MPGYLHILETPKQWQAGRAGADRTPFYFGCGYCEKHEPVIHGFLACSTDPDFENIALVNHEFPYRLALLCEDCLREMEKHLVPGTGDAEVAA